MKRLVVLTTLIHLGCDSVSPNDKHGSDSQDKNSEVAADGAGTDATSGTETSPGAAGTLDLVGKWLKCEDISAESSPRGQALQYISMISSDAVDQNVVRKLSRQIVRLPRPPRSMAALPWHSCWDH